MQTQNVVGPQIRYHRAQLDLTQEELAARCGVAGWRLSRVVLAKIESQLRCVTDAELFVLAKALRQPLDSLFPKDTRAILRALKDPD